MQRMQADVREKGGLILDGGWGTFLIADGLQAGECPELYNLEKPAVVQGIAQAYVDAGADVVTTNSFGASRIKLAQYGLEDRAAEINEAAARLSRAAAGDAVHVMASIGPTGKFLMMGEVTEETLYEAFKEQALAFERGGADACIVETMTALDEAMIAVRAVKENTDLEIACSFSYASEKQGEYYTMMGVTPVQMAAAALEAGAEILGANCSFGCEMMVNIVAALHDAAPETPILVNPNAGQPVHTEEGDRYPETPEFMAAYLPKFLAAGARLIGGCCGTTPAHIRALRACFDAQAAS